MTSHTDTSGRTDVRHAIDGLGSVSEDMLAQVRVAATGAAETLADQAPVVMAKSQEALDQVGATLRGSSSDSLLLGTVFCAGLWSGLVLARAPRLAILLALIPAVVLAGTLVSRTMPTDRRARR